MKRLLWMMLTVLLLLSSCALAEDGDDVEAVHVIMQRNTVYDLGSNSRATYMVINAAGDYYLQGKSSNTLVVISAPEGAEAVLHLMGVILKPDNSAPGAVVGRSPLTIEDTGAVIHLRSGVGTVNEFYGYNPLRGMASLNYTSYPAIRKDGVRTKLIFESEGDSEDKGWGTIIARADEDDLFTPGIGCYDRYMGVEKYTFGNVWFESGIIKAYGANGTSAGFLFEHVSGPGIGGGWGTEVDGLHFTGASVYAYSLSPSAAAIGTSVFGQNVVIGSFGEGIRVHNIEITGGKVHAEILNGKGDEVYGGSAAIGGGTFCGAEGIRISGGVVEALAGKSSFGAGIGGGSGGDGGTPAHPIEISGGQVRAEGGSAGIGAGQHGSNDEQYCDAVVHISGGVVDATATSGGPGIGGNRNAGGNVKSSRTEISISGGTVNATGHAGGAGIGCSALASVHSITITGGRVTAIGGENGVGIGGSCRIASTSYYDGSVLGSVTISGGRVKATGNPAGIGGYSSKRLSDGTVCTDIFITGGNVNATVFGTQPTFGKKGAALSLHRYALMGSGLQDESLRVTHLEAEEGSALMAAYGTQDMYLFPGDDAGMAFVYLWLDKEYGATGVGLSSSLLYTGFDAVTAGSGKTSPHYPGVSVTLVGQSASLPQGALAQDGKAVLRHGYRSADGFVAAEVAGLWASGYYLDNESAPTRAAINGDGTRLLSAISDASGRYIADEAALREGLTLYALWSALPYDVYFEDGLPPEALLPAEGHMSPLIGIGPEETFTLPECGYRVPGYRFMGWGLERCGGTVYAAGQQVSGLTDRLSITLYAQWQAAPDYRIIEGAGSVWTTGDTAPLRFVANGELADLRALAVDGALVQSGNYTTAAGSTILLLSPEWLGQLSYGTHTLKMIYCDGETDTVTFTLRPPVPATGDGARPAWWLGLLLLSLMGLGLLLRRRRG